MIEVGVVLLMGIFALLTIQSSLLRLSIVYLAVFSLLAAFLYLLYAAPELAIAEAVIGSGLVPLLYLAALKQTRVYTIAVVSERNHNDLTDRFIFGVERSKALEEIKAFFERREFEVQVVFVNISREEALKHEEYDLVLERDEDGIVVYTDDESYVMLELELMFQMHGTDSALRFVRYSQEAVL